MKFLEELWSEGREKIPSEEQGCVRKHTESSCLQGSIIRVLGAARKTDFFPMEALWDKVCFYTQLAKYC